eukprot:COSAG02_NODE_4386_length_5421_cov_4.810973_2_plen_183_part_00
MLSGCVLPQTRERWESPRTLRRRHQASCPSKAQHHAAASSTHLLPAVDLPQVAAWPSRHQSRVSLTGSNRPSQAPQRPSLAALHPAAPSHLPVPPQPAAGARPAEAPTSSATPGAFRQACRSTVCLAERSFHSTDRLGAQFDPTVLLFSLKARWVYFGLCSRFSLGCGPTIKKFTEKPSEFR